MLLKQFCPFQKALSLNGELFFEKVLLVYIFRKKVFIGNGWCFLLRAKRVFPTRLEKHKYNFQRKKLFLLPQKTAILRHLCVLFEPIDESKISPHPRSKAIFIAIILWNQYQTDKSRYHNWGFVVIFEKNVSKLNFL